MPSIHTKNDLVKSEVTLKAILKFSVENSCSYDDKFLLEFWTLKAGEEPKERQCTLEGQAWYVNVQDSVHTTYNIYD